MRSSNIRGGQPQPRRPAAGASQRPQRRAGRVDPWQFLVQHAGSRMLPVRSHRYQMRTRSAGARYSFCPACTSNAAYHASMFRTMLARCSGRRVRVGQQPLAQRRRRGTCARHTCAQPRKKRWSPVKPSITGGGLAAERERDRRRRRRSGRRGRPMFSPIVSLPLTCMPGERLDRRRTAAPSLSVAS